MVYRPVSASKNKYGSLCTRFNKTEYWRDCVPYVTLKSTSYAIVFSPALRGFVIWPREPNTCSGSHIMVPRPVSASKRIWFSSTHFKCWSGTLFLGFMVRNVIFVIYTLQFRRFGISFRSLSQFCPIFYSTLGLGDHRTKWDVIPDHVSGLPQFF